MEESRIELSVGESIRLDDQILTVIDIQGDEITFRVDMASDGDADDSYGDAAVTQRPPR